MSMTARFVFSSWGSSISATATRWPFSAASQWALGDEPMAAFFRMPTMAWWELGGHSGRSSVFAAA